MLQATAYSYQTPVFCLGCFDFSQGNYRLRSSRLKDCSRNKAGIALLMFITDYVRQLFIFQNVSVRLMKRAGILCLMDYGFERQFLCSSLWIWFRKSWSSNNFIALELSFSKKLVSELKPMLPWAWHLQLLGFAFNSGLLPLSLASVNGHHLLSVLYARNIEVFLVTLVFCLFPVSLFPPDSPTILHFPCWT